MGPKRNSRSTTEADVSGRMDDDALALRIIELLNDDAVVSKLKNALYPQVLADKLDQQTAQIDRLLAQLIESKTGIEQLESRVGELEDQADHTEQYSRRANLIFTGMSETGSGENVEEKMLAVINETMALRPPLSPHDLERSHRLGKRRDERHTRPVIVRFSSDRVRDRVFRARTSLKPHNTERRDKPIFVNEDLTAKRSKLAFATRQLKRQRKITDCWTVNGKILVKDNSNRIVEIRSLDMLQKYN